MRGSDDFDLIAVGQLRRQRNEFVVNMCGNAAVADVGMHRVGKVDDRCTARQRQNPTLGGEHIDFVGEEIDLDVLKEFRRVTGRTL